MADNGSAGNLFNDRRGTNPFQPVTPAPMRVRPVQHTPISTTSVHGFGGTNYLGQGQTIPNGALPPRVINGMTYTRDNPDVVGLRRRQLEIGERSSL